MPAPGLAEINVVASIKPVHSLVAGVMQGIGEPALLVKGASSPHGYSLRPSDARALDQAHVVFWVGESLETYLAKPLQALSAAALVVPLSEVEGVRLLAAREGGVWEEHEQASRAERREGGQESDRAQAEADDAAQKRPRPEVARRSRSTASSTCTSGSTRAMRKPWSMPSSRRSATRPPERLKLSGPRPGGP